MFWDRYSTFCTILTNLFEFFYVDPNDRTTFFLHFNVLIADKPYKTNLYDLDDKFFWKFRKFAKKMVYIEPIWKTHPWAIKHWKKAQNAKNAKFNNFDPLPLKNYDWKKSEKIQGLMRWLRSHLGGLERRKIFSRRSVRELPIYIYISHTCIFFFFFFLIPVYYLQSVEWH